jgi:peptidoglycan/LPS O-acetylase OafA/YrhL
VIEDYRPDIDGMRCIAVLGVVIFHAGFRTLQGGFTGVDVFFVLSGFLIGGHIFRETRMNAFSYASFYRRRAKRILPALYVVLAATLVLGCCFLSPEELVGTARQSIATLLFASNIHFWRSLNYFAASSDQSPLLMTWSLGVEEQFYIVIPLVIAGLVRRKYPLIRILLGLTLFSFALSVFQVHRNPIPAFYLLPSRAWELLAGVLPAIWNHGREGGAEQPKAAHQLQSILGLLLIFASFLYLNSAMPFPGLAALPPVLGTALLLNTRFTWINRTVLSAKPLAFVGRISYSLYLWHWPLLAITRVVRGGDPTRAQAVMIVFLSFLLAVGSYYFVETPFRRTRTPSRALLLRYAAVTASFLLVFFAVTATRGIAMRSPALAAAEKLDLLHGDPCLVDYDEDRPYNHSPCSEDNGRPVVLIWGDSHANAIAPAVRDRAHAANFDLVEMTKGRCPPLVDTGKVLVGRPRFHAACIGFNNYVIQRAITDPRIKVVLLTAHWSSSLIEPYTLHDAFLAPLGASETTIPSESESEQILSASLASTVVKLRGAGKTVILMQDVPGFDVSPLWIVRTANFAPRLWLAQILLHRPVVDYGSEPRSDSAGDDAARAVIANVAARTGVPIYDQEKPLCTPGSSCEYRDARQLFFVDANHLNDHGAEFVMDQLPLPKP